MTVREREREKIGLREQEAVFEISATTTMTSITLSQLEKRENGREKDKIKKYPLRPFNRVF